MTPEERQRSARTAPEERQDSAGRQGEALHPKVVSGVTGGDDRCDSKPASSHVSEPLGFQTGFEAEPHGQLEGSCSRLVGNVTRLRRGSVRGGGVA